MKFHSAVDGSYVDVGSDEIDICQGFVVFAESGGVSISTARSNQTQGTAPKAGDEINRMTLLASSGENTVYALLVVNENSSSAFEWQTDSRYLQPISDLPLLSMLTSDEVKVPPNTISLYKKSEIIQVSFNVVENETIIFTLKDFAHTLGVKNVILKDQNYNTFTSLFDGDSYTFNATTGDDPLRFKLHINEVNGFGDLEDLEWFDVYSSGKTIYFNSNKAEKIIVYISNWTRQLIVNKQLIISGLTPYEVEVQTGWYLMKVLKNENSFAEKVFIH